MSGAELPDFSSMFGGGDQTVEMSNPLAGSALPMPGAAGTEEDDLNTQELSPDIVQKSLQHLGARAQRGPEAAQDSEPATQIAPPPFIEQAPRQRVSASVEPTPAPGGGANFGATPAPRVSQSGSSPAMPPPQPVGGIDPAHDGPWKLQTNFGLTYEFADNKSLRSWLASREDLEGYKLSAGDTFHPLGDYPQFSPGGASAARSGNFSVASSGSQAPVPALGGGPSAPAGASSSGAAPAMPGQSGGLPAMNSPAPGAGPQGGPPMPAAPSASPFMTAGMPAIGQKPPASQERVKIDPNAGFKPPTRDSNALTMVLWGVFAILGLVAVALGLHLGGIVNFPALGGASEAAAPAPALESAPTPAPAEAAEAPASEAAQPA